MPYPANYGGAIDEFYKIKYLYQKGVKIILHCFLYKNFTTQNELNKYCENVYYYKRSDKWYLHFSKSPYIVKSRANKELLTNLIKDDYPILFEGLHTTTFLNHPSLKNRKKMVRLHNIEWIYYRNIVEQSYTIKEKLFHFLEYKKLKKYELLLTSASLLMPISIDDAEYYEAKFPTLSVKYIPAFHQHTTIESKLGNGKYILLHGNFSIEDNYLYFIHFIKNNKKIEFEIKFAGKEPSVFVQKFCKENDVQLIPNPSDNVLHELIQNAHINLIFSTISTGIKLKLLHNLFVGRFCFASESVVVDSNLESTIVIVDENNLFDKLTEYMQVAFTNNDLEKRVVALKGYINNENAIAKMYNLIF